MREPHDVAAAPTEPARSDIARDALANAQAETAERKRRRDRLVAKIAAGLGCLVFGLPTCVVAGSKWDNVREKGAWVVFQSARAEFDCCYHSTPSVVCDAAVATLASLDESLRERETSTRTRLSQFLGGLIGLKDLELDGDVSAKQAASELAKCRKNGH